VTSLPSILKEISAISSSGYKELISSLSKRYPLIGFFCPYVPEEMIHAAGAFPLRLMGPSIKISQAHAHLPLNCCYFVKSSLESLLQGELNLLRGIVFSHSCDTMQGLADIWSLQRRIPLQFNLMMPSNLDSELSVEYLRAEMERFKNFLESNVGKITPLSLKASIGLFNQIREKIQRLYMLRRTYPKEISGADFARLIRAGYLMDRQHYLELLDEILKVLSQNTEETESRVPIFLVGNMVHSDSYFSLIEEAGALIVQDDLCSGSRFLRLKVQEDTDPLEGLTHRYFQRFMCPTKFKGAYAHMETLLEEVQKSRAKGVIFLLYKYCENHFFDIPDLKKTFESKAIPTLLLEVEDPIPSQGQLKIRIQAFLEMLSFSEGGSEL
jgi:benzoyl-CoA reductase/2-hydroxyglutaryl-CoA dehydratase subunit BcrC/BadD/HgdB